MAAGISEADYTRLKNNIDEYISTNEDIRVKTANLKILKDHRGEVYANIMEAMEKNDIAELEVPKGKIKLIKSQKKKGFNEDIIRSAILSGIKTLDQKVSDIGYNKVVDMLVDAIQEERVVEEKTDLKFNKKGKNKGK